MKMGMGNLVQLGEAKIKGKEMKLGGKKKESHTVKK